MRQCVLKQDQRVNAFIYPWHHERPIPITLRAGKMGKLAAPPVQIEDGHYVAATFQYVNRMVTAILPGSALAVRL